MKNGSTPSGDGSPPGNGNASSWQSLNPVNGQPHGAAGPHDDEITLQEITEMLWGGKWVVLATFLVVLGLGAAYTFSRTPVYETSSLVLVEQGQSSVSSVLGRQGSSYSPFGSRGNLVNEVLVANQSESIARSVAARLDTMKTNPQTGEPLAVLTGPEGEQRTVGQIADDLRGAGGKATMVAEMAGQGMGSQYASADALTLAVKGVSPSETALISNLYAQAYINYNRRKSKESARSTRKFLEQQASKFKARVDKSERELESFMREEKAVALDQETSRIVDQIANLQTRRDEIRIELDMKQQSLNSKREELANIRPNLAERISSGLGDELSQVQKEKAEVATEINEVRRNNPSLNPDGSSSTAREFARLKERARSLEQESDSLAREYVRQTIAAGGIGSIPAMGQGRRGRGQQGRGLSYVVELQRQVVQKRIEVGGLQAQLATVKERLSEYQGELNTLPAQSLQLAQLQRERRAAEQMYKFIQEQLQETRMMEESEVGYAEVIR